jgi:xanthine/uracil permease
MIGAIHAYHSTVHLDQSRLENNMAKKDGGAVLLGHTITTITYTTFSSNNCCKSLWT